MTGYKLILSLICVLLLGCNNTVGQNIQIVDKQQMNDNVIGKNVQLIDVRSVEEYEAGHIGNAVNYNISNRDAFLDQINKLDKTQPVYLYCKIGGRSNRAAKLLQKQGFQKIFDYSGGYSDWVSD